MHSPSLLRFALLLGSVFISTHAAGQVRLELGELDNTQSDTLTLFRGIPVTLSAVPLSRAVTFAVPDAPLFADSIAFLHPDQVVLRAASVDSVVAIARYRPMPFISIRRSAVPGIVPVQTDDSVAVLKPIAEPSNRVPATSDPFGNTNLRRSGSISRGVIAGNRQDATIESGLRLQLAGEIVEGVNLKAVLSDENTPILPEGTTQRIDEFDKVFIEVSGRRGTAQLGDFELTLDGSQFAKFSRKLQGVNVSGGTESLLSEARFGATGIVSAATTRGLFRTQSLAIEDGAQGPYRLEGDNGERFIILIPASEIVYLNGARLTRGESNDYVVDYATAEITFTPNRLMSRDQRVVVEFQYTTNQFTRTLVAAESKANYWSRPDGSSRATMSVSFIRESDSRQFFDEFGLTSADSLLISQAGDAGAIRSGAEVVEYNPEALFVQYTFDEVVLNGGTSDSAFVVVGGLVSDTTQVFRVRCSTVGAGNGRYRRVGRNINGIVYEYVGAGRGEYEPVRRLPLPRQQRLFDIASEIEIVKGLLVYGEFAQSSTDENRLSALDSDDDIGRGAIGGIRLAPKSLGLIGGQPLEVSASIERNRRQQTFRTFNRTRTVEFSRDWNLGNRGLSATGGVESNGAELIDLGTINFKWSKIGVLGARYGRMDLGSTFSAKRWLIDLRNDTRTDSSQSLYQYSVQNVTSTDLAVSKSGSWFRQKGSIRGPRMGGWIAPQLSFDQERLEQRIAGTDSLTNESLAFIDVRPGVGFFGTRSSAFAELQYRNEDEVLGAELTDGSTSMTGRVRLQLRTKGSLRSNGTFGYRIRRYADPVAEQFGRQDQESLVLSWNGDWRPLERAITASWLYEAQTERTPKLQEIYVRTGPEFGDYVWLDDNNDGVLQIEEFVLETTPNEGVYSRTFVPSDSLFSTVAVRARGRFDFDPGVLVKGSQGRLARIARNVFLSSLIEVSE